MTNDDALSAEARAYAASLVHDLLDVWAAGAERAERTRLYEMSLVRVADYAAENPRALLPLLTGLAHLAAYSMRVLDADGDYEAAEQIPADRVGVMHELVGWIVENDAWLKKR